MRGAAAVALALALCGLLVALILAGPARAEPPIRQLAARHGIAIGTAVGGPAASRDLTYAMTVAREFSVLTPENVLKWQTVRWGNRTWFDWAQGDAIASFAGAFGQTVRGHTLVWGRALPAWLEDGHYTRAELLDILHEHVTAVVGHYRAFGVVRQWDVVNEAVDARGDLERNFWLRGIGPEYIELAFRWAHEADPTARLFYNDFRAEFGGPKSDGVYRLVRSLKRRGVPIHGVGLQMHLRAGARLAGLRANMARLNALGLETAVTELDVRVPNGADALRQQARTYADVLRACLAARNCKTFVLWGFTDRHSWVPSRFPGYGRATLFDGRYRRKPAYAALREVLR